MLYRLIHHCSHTCYFLYPLFFISSFRIPLPPISFPFRISTFLPNRFLVPSTVPASPFSPSPTFSPHFPPHKIQSSLIPLKPLYLSVDLLSLLVPSYFTHPHSSLLSNFIHLLKLPHLPPSTSYIRLSLLQIHLKLCFFPFSTLLSSLEQRVTPRTPSVPL